VLITHIVTLIATGAFAGFAGGLLGIGGGFILTPVQYAIFTDIGVPADVAIKLAFGTSLFVVLPTAASGTWRHNRWGTVKWRVALVMGSCGMAASFGGATIASYLPGDILTTAFGVLILLGCGSMLIFRPKNYEQEPVRNPWLWAFWAVHIGFVTGLFGIGGGIVAVPVMVLALRFKMHEAVATSLATMMFSSFGGVIGYIVNGQGVPDLPSYSFGYVNLRSWFLLSVGSIGMVQVGVRVAHKLPAKQLRYIFMILLLYIGLRMVGLFEWLGWPI